MDEKEEENLRKTLIDLAMQLARIGVEAGVDYLKGRLKGKSDFPQAGADDNDDG